MNILEHWLHFRAMCIPEHASDIQVREMRKAFYAGIATMLGITAGMFEERLTDGEVIQVLVNLEKELREFVDRFKPLEEQEKLNKGNKPIWPKN